MTDAESVSLTRKRFVVRTAVLALWLAGVVLTISSGWQPGYWWDRPWPYPFGHVLLVIVQNTIVSLALYDLLRPRSEGSSLARTARAAAASFVTLAWMVIMSFTDQPGYAYAGQRYVMLLTAVLVLTLIAHGTVAVIRVFNRRRHAA